MRKYLSYHIPLLSFFSDELYFEVGRTWRGTCLGYLLFLTAVCFVPYMAKIHTWYTHFLDDVAPAIIAQLPELRIIDGEMSLTAAQPYFIIDPETERVVVAIDTTGAFTSLKDTTAPVLITKTKVFTRSIDADAHTIDFRTMEDTVIDQVTIAQWLDRMRTLLVPVVYPFGVLGVFAYRALEAILYAALGTLFASWNNARLPYQAVLRLAIVSLTPCIIGDAILISLGVSIPFGGLFFFLVAIGYLFFGIRVCVQSDPPPMPQDYPPGGGGGYE